jgi:hypothetical protein
LAKRCQFICFVILAIFFLAVGVASANAEVVEKVTVNIIPASETQEPPDRIAKRMAASVSTVGEHVLLGRKVSDIIESRASYEKLIKEIFERVLVGYSVQQVTIIPGSQVQITVEIASWGEVVHDVKLEVDVGSVSPDVLTLVKKDIGDLESQVNGLLIGLPIDAVDWAGSVSKVVIRDMLAVQLPEFYANLDIVPGSHTIVKLSLSPRGPLVQSVHVTLQSQTIPNLLLFQVRPTVEDATNSLIGLPVTFIDRHRDYFTAKLLATAAQQPVTRRYGLLLTPVINAGSDTEIILQAETTKYRVLLEGYLDIDRADDATSFKLHAGKLLNKRDEAFLEVNFIPSKVTWEFLPGWGHRIGSTDVGMKYNTTSERGIFWLNQELGHHWTLRMERTPVSGYTEVGVRYKLHEFLSAEYVITNNENWLRLVANL